MQPFALVAAEDARDLWKHACFPQLGSQRSQERRNFGECRQLLRCARLHAALATCLKMLGNQRQPFHVDSVVIGIQSPRLASVPHPLCLCGSDRPSEPINCHDVTQQRYGSVSGPCLCVVGATLSSSATFRDFVFWPIIHNILN